MRKHYGEKPFKCDQCDFATHSDSNLQSHKRNRHIEKPFKCEFCDYGAVKDSDLQRHMRQFHTMERPFKWFGSEIKPRICKRSENFLKLFYLIEQIE